MPDIDLHPSELAYAMSYARADSLIGWGAGPFQPDADADRAAWAAQGEARMIAAGRLTGTPEAGLNFTDAMTGAILALVDPSIVLLAQRKADQGVQVLTAHVRGADVIGLTRRGDGMFGLTRYADLTAAAAACAAFVGASLVPPLAATRIETTADVLSDLRRMARGGQTDAALTALRDLGAMPAGAASALNALAAPAQAGVVSVLYCAGNQVTGAEVFTVLSDATGATWVRFPPAGPDGPEILEASSVAALAARVTVGIAARQMG